MKFATIDETCIVLNISCGNKTVDEILWLDLQIDNLIYDLPLNTFSHQCSLYSVWENFKLYDCKEMYKPGN
jgi:hypothetical protein